MRSVALTRVGTIAPIVAFLDRVGVQRDRLLATAQLPPWIATPSEALIPAASPARLFAAARPLVDIPNLGLRVGEQTDLASFGRFGHLVRSAPTLGAALEAAVRYSTALTPSRPLQLRPRGDLIEFCMTVTAPFEPRDVAWQEDDHFCLGLMIASVRLALGSSWRPGEVHLRTAEAPGLCKAESLAGARVAFRQPTTMVAIPRALLAVRLPPLPPPDMPADVGHWQSSAPACDFAGSIRQAVETLSGGGRYPSVRQTAKFVGLSVRTLQRRLWEVGISHQGLVAQTRFATATIVLEKTKAKVLDVALDLGYSDHANFTRAFRRWAGCSPQAYRRGRAGAAGAPAEPAAMLHPPDLARGDG